MHSKGPFMYHVQSVKGEQSSADNDSLISSVEELPEGEKGREEPIVYLLFSPLFLSFLLTLLSFTTYTTTHDFTAHSDSGNSENQKR